MEAFRTAVAEWGSGSTLALFASSIAGDARARATRARFERISASPSLASSTVEALANTDVSDLLPDVSVPTLVVHRTGELVPVEEARYLAEHISDARLAEISGVDHLPWVGDSTPIIDEIAMFLRSLSPECPEPSDHQNGGAANRQTRPVTGWRALTDRESTVADLAACGYSNPEIARRLYISRYTVETHLKHVYAKLGMDSRVSLAVAVGERANQEGNT